MTTKRTTRNVLHSRKKPSQGRSAETVAVILEAAARILERSGLAGFNTNSVAAQAGVSIGSLYQYFPNKHSLLSALMQREMTPLVEASERLLNKPFLPALRGYIRACVGYQMKRPDLARIIDIAERQVMFDEQNADAKARLHGVMEQLLKLADAPRVRHRRVAAADTLAIVRALTDAAGERGEGESSQLTSRIEGAVLGYLNEPVRISVASTDARTALRPPSQ